MDLALCGRTALVAASTSGLGLGAARALAHEGARVVISGRRAEVAQREANALPDTYSIPADLTVAGEPERLAREATALAGPIDILILNSGGPPPGTAAAASPGDLEGAVRQLFLQHVALIGEVLPGMRQRGWGRIVAIGSSGIQAPIPNLALSNAGRAALSGYLKTLSAEIASEGVTVNMVLPGRIDTPRVTALDKRAAQRFASTPAEARARSEASIPAGRYGSVEEFAAVVAFLCSGAASYVTGAQVRCDGGLVSSF